MRYKVLLTAGAESDLEDLYGYIAEYDSPNSADYVLDRLMEVAESGYFPRAWFASARIIGTWHSGVSPIIL